MKIRMQMVQCQGCGKTFPMQKQRGTSRDEGSYCTWECFDRHSVATIEGSD